MDNLWFEEEKWWVSPYNFIDEVRKEFSLPKKVLIHDATLRDGEQTPGVVFTKENKIRIAQELDSIGVDRIEAGMPAVSQDDFEAIKEITKLNLNAKIFTFARALKQDIDKAVDCGAYGVVIEVPIGFPKLKYQFKWTWEDVLRKSINVINYAKEKELYVVYFPYDTTRAKMSDLENLLSGIIKYSNPDSVGVVDTMGCALPQAIQFLVKKVKKLTNLPVEVHTHNDFGMAVATELAGIMAGAEVVHSCINGLGERTGNAALEELMLGIHVLLGIRKNNYKFNELIKIASLIEEITGIKLPQNKPITGKKNFTRESGIGVDLVIKKPLAMFATDPKFTGRKGAIVLGKKSGKLSILYNLERIGIKNIGEQKLVEILKMVKLLGISKRELVSLNEFKEITKRVLG